MNKLKHILPEQILHTPYCTLVLPYLNYGILMWGNVCKSYIDKLVKLQKRAVRIISGVHFRSHTSPLFAKHNLLNVHDLYSIELGVFMYKYSNDKLPTSFKNYFSRRSDILDYQTRRLNDFNHTKNKKVFSDHSMRTCGTILWNSLSSTIKTAKSIKHFRTQPKCNLSKLMSNINHMFLFLSCPCPCPVLFLLSFERLVYCFCG